MNSLLPISYGLNSITIVLLQGQLRHWITHEVDKPFKQINQNKQFLNVPHWNDDKVLLYAIKYILKICETRKLSLQFLFRVVFTICFSLFLSRLILSMIISQRKILPKMPKINFGVYWAIICLILSAIFTVMISLENHKHHDVSSISEHFLKIFRVFIKSIFECI